MQTEKERYERFELEIVCWGEEDIIRTSTGELTDSGDKTKTDQDWGI